MLADQILVIDRGAAIARGTSRELKAQVGGERIEVTLADPAQTRRAFEAVAALAGDDAHVDEDSRAISFAAGGGHQLLPATVRALDEADIGIHELSLRRASLDDVFLTLTGRTAEASAEAMQEAS